jgi:protein tyrosine/serine phosphatase
MGGIVRWLLAATVLGLIAVCPVAFYRSVYAHNKRLREVCPGRVYRSGQMTAAGFAQAVERLGIRTVLNLQDDYPDPDISLSWLGSHSLKESELCRQLQVRFVFIAPDLIPRRLLPQNRPEAIERFLAVMDDPKSYPVLIHCKAGLHRTGVVVAVYRMEYEGWSPEEAARELLANGFGRTAGTAANDYITQYVLSYRPGLRQPEALLSSDSVGKWFANPLSEPWFKKNSFGSSTP